MNTTQELNDAASGQSELTDGLGMEEPILSFHGKELVFLLAKWWQIARITDCIGEEYYQEHGDPMESQEAMSNLLQEIADELMSLEKRKDGTLIFEDKPLIFNFDNENESAV
jgi:hypothetical protein